MIERMDHVEDYVFDSGESMLIIEHAYTVHCYFTFFIKVKSGDFSGASTFCLPGDDIISAINQLSEINCKIEGNCTLKDTESDDYIKFVFEKFDHVNVSGKIGGVTPDNYLNYSFKADQTIITNIITYFRNVLRKK